MPPGAEHLWSPRGDYVAFVADSKPFLWDVADRSAIELLPNASLAGFEVDFVWSADGSTLGLVHNCVRSELGECQTRYFAFRSGRLLQFSDSTPTPSLFAFPRVSADGRYSLVRVGTATTDYAWQAWDLDTGAISTIDLPGFDYDCTNACFAPVGSAVVFEREPETGSTTLTYELVDVASMSRRVLNPPPMAGTPFIFWSYSPDGHFNGYQNSCSSAQASTTEYALMDVVENRPHIASVNGAGCITPKGWQKVSGQPSANLLLEVDYFESGRPNELILWSPRTDNLQVLAVSSTSRSWTWSPSVDLVLFRDGLNGPVTALPLSGAQVGTPFLTSIPQGVEVGHPSNSWSSRGDRLAMPLSQPRVGVWNRATNSFDTLTGNGSTPTYGYGAWSPDSRYFASPLLPAGVAQPYAAMFDLHAQAPNDIARAEFSSLGGGRIDSGSWSPTHSVLLLNVSMTNYSGPVMWYGEDLDPEPLPGDRNSDGRVRIAVLGDSYISGEGSHEPPYDACTDAGTPCNYDNDVGPDSWFIDTNANGTWDAGERVKLSRNNCHRSPNAWPRVLANRLGSEDEDLLFVPCSGAVSANVTIQGQVSGDDQIRSGDLGGLPAAIYNGSPPGIAGGEPQLQALRDWDEAAPGTADAVFVSLGGNDFGFADIIKKCALPVVGCSASFREDVLDRIEDSASDLAFAFEAIRDTVDGAPVYAFTYPMVVPPQGDRCGAVGGLDWIRSTVLPAINGAVVTAARSAGIRSVDISGMNLGDFALPNIFAGHEICSGAPWVNELTNIQQESYHPTAMGHAAITAAVQDYLVDTDVLNTVSNPAPTGEVEPTAPTLYSAARFWGVRVDPWTGRADSQNWLTANVVAPADSVLSLVLRSEPQVLATTTVGSDGIWDISMSLPSDLPSGLHTLSVEDNLGNVLASIPLAIESPPSSSGSEQQVSVNVVGSRSWQGATTLSEPAFEVVVSPDGGLESLEGSAEVTTSSGERLAVAASVRRLLWWSFGSITVTNLATARTVQGVSIFAPATDLIRTTATVTIATIDFFGLSFYRWQPIQNRLTLIVESTTESPPAGE